MSSRNIPNLESLPLELVYQNIKELDIKSRLNLLQVNKKYYDILVNLPNSMKPQINCEIKLRENKIIVTHASFRKNVKWTFHGWNTIFNLFDKFYCLDLFIDVQTESDEEKYCQFILMNRKHFNFSTIMINFIPSKLSYPDMWLEMLSLFDTARLKSSITTRIDTASFEFEETPLIIHDDVIPVFEELILKSYNIDNLKAKFSINFCREFLKQISEGKRPGFEELFIHNKEMVKNDYQTLISGITCEYRVIGTVNDETTIDIPTLRYNLEISAMDGAVEVLPPMRAADIARMNGQDL